VTGIVAGAVSGAALGAAVCDDVQVGSAATMRTIVDGTSSLISNVRALTDARSGGDNALQQQVLLLRDGAEPASLPESGTAGAHDATPQSFHDTALPATPAASHNAAATVAAASSASVDGPVQDSMPPPSSSVDGLAGSTEALDELASVARAELDRLLEGWCRAGCGAKSAVLRNRVKAGLLTQCSAKIV
jgi:hypothetical protein